MDKVYKMANKKVLKNAGIGRFLFLNRHLIKVNLTLHSPSLNLNLNLNPNFKN